jgi:hypothetical protein
MCRKIIMRTTNMLVALIVAYSFVCVPDGRAGDNSLHLDGIDIQLGMSKAELEKRLPGKYYLKMMQLPTERQKYSGLSHAWIYEPAANTIPIPGSVYFENDRIVSIDKTGNISNESDTVKLVETLRAAFVDMLAGKQVDVVAVAVSTDRYSTGLSVDRLSFGLGNRLISINIGSGLEIEGKKFAPEIHVVESLATPSFRQSQRGK